MSKDINFRDPACKHTLASGLNYYSQTFDFKDSKKWSIDWIQQHLPDEYDRLKDAKEHLFSNRGFVCRMIKNGLEVSEQQKHDLNKFFMGINTTRVVEETKETEPKPKRKPVEKVNEVIFQMDDVVDAILSDEEPKPVTIPIDKSQLIEAQGWLEKQIVDAQEQVAKQQAILEQLISAYERCGGIKEKLSKPKKPAKVKDTKESLNTEKANAVKTMKYLKKNEELGIESLSPARIVGSQEALLYNAKYRTLIRYVAEPGKTLTVSGSSVRNWDQTKSTSKTVRKPKETLLVKDVWAAYDLVKTTAKTPNSRVNEEVLILSVR